MMFKGWVLFFAVFFLAAPVLALPDKGQRPPQEEGIEGQINDFSLSASGEKGKKLWEISGKTADMLTDLVK